MNFRIYVFQAHVILFYLNIFIGLDTFSKASYFSKTLFCTNVHFYEMILSYSLRTCQKAIKMSKPPYLVILEKFDYRV